MPPQCSPLEHAVGNPGAVQGGAKGDGKSREPSGFGRQLVEELEAERLMNPDKFYAPPLEVFQGPDGTKRSVGVQVDEFPYHHLGAKGLERECEHRRLYQWNGYNKSLVQVLTFVHSVRKGEDYSERMECLRNRARAYDPTGWRKLVPTANWE
jgi:hypothetical protein